MKAHILWSVTLDFLFFAQAEKLAKASVMGLRLFPSSRSAAVLIPATRGLLNTAHADERLPQLPPRKR